MRDRMDAQNNAGWTPRGRAELAGGREAIVYEVNGVLDAGAGRARLAPMILVGQYDSPFVRRVGVSLRVLGFDYEHDRRSVFGAFASIRETHPLGRIPSLLLEDRTLPLDSAAPLPWLHETVRPRAALIPRTGARGLQR